ncbi:MAG TPA: hypothetical protein VM582_09955, partial [Candidatus Thermoplasmatota archaeon]|nr:hypothetical protein [Candidatus Thermoplasmatota archaeon]
ASRWPARAVSQRDDALARGIAFLARRQDASGRWWDYPDAAVGASTEWVTAFVGASLARVPDPLAQRCARAAWRWLRARVRPSGGWGWSALFPADADSTAWGLLLAARLGIDDARVRRARRFLDAHATAGGVATFRARGPLSWLRHALDARTFAGWARPHACVTALAATLPRPPPGALDALRAMQRPEGEWRAYWWPDDEYATALAVEALARAGDAAAAETGARWLAARLGAERSASASAWALLGLAAAGEARPEAAGRLARAAQDDGGWPASSWMRVVHPDEADPPREGWQRGLGAPGGVIVDERRLLTSAAAVAALAVAK